MVFHQCRCFSISVSISASLLSLIHIYARQSVDKKDSISIESQIEFCKYELKGGNCKEYTDKGYSGKNTDRPKSVSYTHLDVYKRQVRSFKNWCGTSSGA